MRFKRTSVATRPLEQVFVALILYVSLLGLFSLNSFLLHYILQFIFKEEKNSKPI